MRKNSSQSAIGTWVVLLVSYDSFHNTRRLKSMIERRKHFNGYWIKFTLKESNYSKEKDTEDDAAFSLNVYLPAYWSLVGTYACVLHVMHFMSKTLVLSADFQSFKWLMFSFKLFIVCVVYYCVRLIVYFILFYPVNINYMSIAFFWKQNCFYL